MPFWMDGCDAEALPQEFRDAAVAVARKSEAALKQAARDLKPWLELVAWYRFCRARIWT